MSKENKTNIKKPKNAFIIFCQEKRPQLMKKYPDMKLTDISKKLGEMWHSLNDDDRNMYNIEARKLRDKYISSKKTSSDSE